jgi:hypothetical protein
VVDDFHSELLKPIVSSIGRMAAAEYVREGCLVHSRAYEQSPKLQCRMFCRVAHAPQYPQMLWSPSCLWWKAWRWRRRCEEAILCGAQFVSSAQGCRIVCHAEWFLCDGASIRARLSHRKRCRSIVTRPVTWKRICQARRVSTSHHLRSTRSSRHCFVAMLAGSCCRIPQRCEAMDCTA